MSRLLLLTQCCLLLLTGVAFATSGFVARPNTVSSSSQPQPESTATSEFVYPIKEQIEIQSALLDDQDVQVAAGPTSISINDIDVASPIIPVGVDANNLFDVPAQSVGWYKHGASPGSPGSTVLAAHVDYNGEKGAFFNLKELQVGATFTVTLQTGNRVTYSVTSNVSYDKTELPLDEIFAKDGPETLRLVTCGGNFDSANRNYLDNVVVTATKITRG